MHRASDFCWTARVSSPSSCWSGFNPAFISMDQLVVKQAADIKHQLSLKEAARGCRKQWKIMRFKRWILPFCGILLLSALTRVSWWQCLLLGATFQEKSLLPSAQQAPLQHTCAWFAEALIWRQPSERGTNYVKLASSVIDSDAEFDREHTIKRGFNSGLPTATSD